jgi:hypothetical protein
MKKAPPAIRRAKVNAFEMLGNDTERPEAVPR